MPVNILVLEAVLEDMMLNGWFCGQGVVQNVLLPWARLELLTSGPPSLLSERCARGQCCLAPPASLGGHCAPQHLSLGYVAN